MVAKYTVTGPGAGVKEFDTLEDTTDAEGRTVQGARPYAVSLAKKNGSPNGGVWKVSVTVDAVTRVPVQAQDVEVEPAIDA